MSSSWLYDVGCRIAQLVTDYVREDTPCTSLADLYHHIERSRQAYNTSVKLLQRIESEWSLSMSSEVHTLSFNDELTGKVFVSLYDRAVTGAHIRIRGSNRDALVVYMEEQQYIVNTIDIDALTDPNHLALIELLEEEVFEHPIIPEWNVWVPPHQRTLH